MMPDEIKGRDALRRWLYAQSHEVAVAIAHRAGMRVAPSFWFVASRGHGESDLTALATTRSLLTSGVAAACPTPEVQAAAGASSSVDTASADASADAAAFAAIAAARSAATYSPGAAADAAAFAATAATARAFATRDVAAGAAADTAAWNAVKYDASILNSLETGRAIFALPLRSEAANPLEDDWGTVRAAWSAAGPGWQFWIDWYEAALAGHPLLDDWDRHWDLLTEIALIPDAEWKAGPERVNGLIAEIVARRSGQRTPADAVADALRRRTSPPEIVASVQRAMDANRHTLPATLDGIEALILLEIERLQKDNYLNVTVPEECRRQIGNYLAMYEAIQALKARIPVQGPTTPEAAAESESLVKLYWKKFKGLSRAKADAVVEGVWQTGAGIVQGGLILASTGLAVSYGVPAYVAVATGAMVFAPHRASEILRVARDALAKS